MKAFFAKYRPYYSPNLTLAVPVMISQLGHTLVQVADSVIVGHFAGTIALAAVSLVNSIFMVVLVNGIGIAYGLTPLISQANGRKDYVSCGRLLSTSLRVNVVTGVLLFSAVYFGTRGFIGHLGQSPAVVKEAIPYLGLLSFSIVPLMVFNTFKQFTEGLGFTRQAMKISIWGNVLNIVLGVIFVKGLFGIAPMGVSGVGLSAVIDRSMMAVVMAIYVFRSPRFRPYIRNFSLSNASRATIRKILKIGVPIALQYTFEISAFSGAAILMGRIGYIEQAAHQVAISLAAMTYMAASGVSAAAAIQSGYNYGRGAWTELRHSAIASYHLVIGLMTITAFLFIGLNTWLPWIYTADGAVIAVAAHLLVIAGFFQLFDGAQVVGLGVLRGMGDVNVPTLITFVAYWLIGLPIGYILGFPLELGASGIWLGLTAGLLFSSVGIYFRFQKVSKLIWISSK